MGRELLSAPAADSTYARIYGVVAIIPAGRVATYGQVAELAGLPWHRVINAKGKISLHTWGGVDRRQRTLLEDEGVAFDRHGRVALSRFRWRPELGGRAAQATDEAT